MDFSVTKSSNGLVRPFEPTPIQILDLSMIDKLHVLRCNARTLHVFRHGYGVVKTIREALSRALVPYYPLAGRLTESSRGELQIYCSGEGVWFVEANASCDLEMVDYFDDVTCVPYGKLLPDFPPKMEQLDPLILIQVTKFKCDGFVMGLVFCHSICDGLGAAQFLNAVGELARGLQHLSIPPVWCRDFSPLPSPISKELVPSPIPHLPPHMPNYHLEHANIDIPLDHINQLKQKYSESMGQTCSAFEVVAATTWMHRTKAINLDQDMEMKLVFFANCRGLTSPPLPKGFYGNCFFPVSVTASSEMLKQAKISDVMKLIQGAKNRLPNEFEKWMKGELKDENGPMDPFAPPLVYTTLFISEWGKLGFNQVDYGYGLPINVVPIQGSSIIPVGIVGHLQPKKGIRMMTWCVEKPHLQPFLVKMKNLTSSE